MGFSIPPYLRLDARDMPEPSQTAQEPPQAPLKRFSHTFTERETRALAGALEFTILLGSETGRETVMHGQLRDRLLRSIGELEADGATRPQQLAADAMHAKYGRYALRHQADGSVVITGLLDDIEMERVCLERDGTERWRS